MFPLLIAEARFSNMFIIIKLHTSPRGINSEAGFRVKVDHDRDKAVELDPGPKSVAGDRKRREQRIPRN